MRSSLVVMLTFVFASVAIHAQSGRTRPDPSRPQTPASTERQTRPTPPVASTEATTRSTTAPVPDPTPNVEPTPPHHQPPSPAPANDPNGVTVDEDDVLDIASNLVPIPVSVIDHSGKPLTNLTLADFQLFVDGVPKNISEIHIAETPVRLALLFDNSESLRATRELEKGAAIKFFTRVMRPIDQAAIFSVRTDVSLEQSLTSDVSKLIGTIKGFAKPEGSTSLRDAIVDAAIYLRPHDGRKVIVIVSDGVDTTSKSTFDDVLRIAQAADCQIYAVQTGYTLNANLRDLGSERRLQQFTAQTGGAVYTPAVVSDLDLAFTQIAADLAQAYVLSYYPIGEPADGRFRLINVRIADHPNVRVRTRKGFYAPRGK